MDREVPDRTTPPVPRILYHTTSAQLYPTNSSSCLVCIRFASPVRVTCLRISPEGVETINGATGRTQPPQWSGRVFLNVSNSHPVNALTSFNLEYSACQHSVDYPIPMKEGTTTRMMMLEAPVDQLTLSVYGFSLNDTPSNRARQPASVYEAEDWSWLSSWAGGPDRLLRLLDDETPRATLDSALRCLELLADIDPSTLTALVGHPTALAFLLSQPSYPPQSLLQRLYTDPTHALHPELRYYLPHSHPLHHLVNLDESERRGEAWKRLDLGRGALMLIAEQEADDLLEVAAGEQRSNLHRILERAEFYASKDDVESKKCLEVSLDILSTLPSNPVAVSHLAGALPRLFVTSRSRGSDRLLPFGAECDRTVIRGLLHASTDVVDALPTAPAAVALAQPYLQNLPGDDLLRYFFDPPHVPHTSTRTLEDEDGRRVSRFADALSDQSPSSIVHSLSPEEILSVIAPSFLSMLQTAPFPPLGISTSLANPTPESQASTWAGKVYSEHEFRNREPPGVASSAQLGLGIQGGPPGMVPPRLSRPASRHVDQFAR